MLRLLCSPVSKLAIVGKLRRERERESKQQQQSKLYLFLCFFWGWHVSCEANEIAQNCLAFCGMLLARSPDFGNAVQECLGCICCRAMWHPAWPCYHGYLIPFPALMIWNTPLSRHHWGSPHWFSQGYKSRVLQIGHFLGSTGWEGHWISQNVFYVITVDVVNVLFLIVVKTEVLESPRRDAACGDRKLGSILQC